VYLATTYCGVGGAYEKLGRYDDAVGAFRRAIELDPKSDIAYNGLGVVLSDMRRHDEAALAFQRAIELDPGNPSAHNNLAGEYLQQGKFDDAKREYGERIRLRPNNAFAPLVMLGVIARHQGAAESSEYFTKALEQWEAALRKGWQTLGGLLEGRAIALLCLGQKTEALETIKQSLVQMLPGDQVDFEEWDLLRTAPISPDGVDQVIALLNEAHAGRQDQQ
jgi:lipoprotein NlpI